MDVTYLVTPEMLGLTRRRVLLQALSAVVIAMFAWRVWYWVFHVRLSTGLLVGLVLTTIVRFLLVRPLSRTKLRITDNGVECSDGPIIPKDEVYRVNEYATDHKVPGLEITGNRNPRWLRKYSIFVPAALPEYEEVRRVVPGWVGAQAWHRV